ncbi:MAG: hypothetical protein PVH63_11500 [Balneolaceae bacterium]|jgi:hypothetical protein
MIKLDLTESEQSILKEILENTLSDLRMEIADTDKFDFRETLKEKKRILEKTIGAIESTTTDD